MGLRDALDDESRRKAGEAERERLALTQEALDTEMAQRLLTELLSEATVELRRLQRPLVGLMVRKDKLFGDRRIPARFVDGGMFWELPFHLLSPEGVLYTASSDAWGLTYGNYIGEQTQKLRARARRARSYPTTFRNLGERVVAAPQGTEEYPASTFHLAANGELAYGFGTAERVLAQWISSGGG